jgi:radical SAM protein with 4Fe4S-binding SPASM domain
MIVSTRNEGSFYQGLLTRIGHHPWFGQIELTYRCNLNCVHCYAKNAGNCQSKKGELTTKEWKQIFAIIRGAGCLNLTFTGGEPLLREDFLELYSYAKESGFIITLFTNGSLLTKKVIDFLEKFPPKAIEITLNSITKNTYEAISQVRGSYSKAMFNIKALARAKAPLIIKSNCLKQNKDEIVKIKKFTEDLLGKRKDGRHYFKYDKMVYPRLNGDRTPCNYRLSFKEIKQLMKEDADMWQEYQKGLQDIITVSSRDNIFLYQCSSWIKQFFINPYGELKFCEFSNKFSGNLKKESFKDIFYRTYSAVTQEKFKTNSKCRDCRLRPFCPYCPAKAYLETGKEEAPVQYYCKLAGELHKEMQRARKKHARNPI